MAKKMYQENLLSRDFAITKTTQIVPDIVNEEKLVQVAIDCQINPSCTASKQRKTRP